MKPHCPHITATWKKSHESIPEWMGRLCINAIGCCYKEYYRRFKEQFINGIDNENIITEIINELTTLKETTEASSEQILMWA